MMKKHKFFALGLATLFCLSSILTIANAVENDAQILSQDSIERTLSEVYEDSQKTDQDIIETVVNLYFDILTENYHGNFNVDNEMLLSSEPQYAACHDYFNAKAEGMFPNGVNSLAVDLDITDIQIKDDKATVTAVFLILYSEGPDEIESGMKITYTLSLQQFNTGWLITDISTNCSEDVASKKCGYITDVETNNIQSEINSNTMTGEEMLEYEQSFIESLALNRASYVNLSRSNARAYAETYWSNYNTNFPSWKSENTDCQNFVSQCLWYGFGGYNYETNIENKDFPMISNWYMTKRNGQTTNWTSNTSFRENVIKSNGSTTGIYGIVYETARKGDLSNENTYENSLATVDVGDVIQFQWNNSTDRHAVIVTQVTGTSGSRTAENIWVSGHTSDEHDTNLATKFSKTKYPRYWVIRVMSIYQA